MMHWIRGLLGVIGTCACGVWLPALAQDVRDPTIAPLEAGQAAGVGAAAAAPLGMDGMAVIVRNGTPYLVVGTRLYSPGQTVGKARLERIAETEVWFREGTALRKIPRYAGIQRTVSMLDCKLAAPAPAVAPPHRKTAKKLATSRRRQTQSAAPSTSPVAAPCTTAQP